MVSASGGREHGWTRALATNGIRCASPRRVLPTAYTTRRAGPPSGGPARLDFCGAEGIRTPDPLHAMEVRYQLRHSPAAPEGNSGEFS